ncbi:hypothetical protein Tco_0539351 [Tanacetum coccineum]
MLEVQNRGGNVNPDQAKPIKCYNLMDQAHHCTLNVLQPMRTSGEQVTNFDDDVDDPTEKDLALNVDHIFEADQCDAFDSDVDEAPNIQTMFMIFEAEIFTFQNENQKDVSDEMIQRFNKLEVVQVVRWLSGLRFRPQLDSVMITLGAFMGYGDYVMGEQCDLRYTTVEGNRSKLKNFVEKFIGTVRFGNDHFGAIMGYGDYVIGDSVISRVYYVEGLGHNLFSVGQFCD